MRSVDELKSPRLYRIIVYMATRALLLTTIFRYLYISSDAKIFTQTLRAVCNAETILTNRQSDIIRIDVCILFSPRILFSCSNNSAVNESQTIKNIFS